MSPTDITELNVNNHKFRIERTIDETNGKINRHALFLVGKTISCIDIFINFEDNKPYKAILPTLLTQEDCSLTYPLERGEGTKEMVVCMLYYIRYHYPTLPFVHFDDMSNIECATEDEIKKDRRIVKKPFPLYYFSIAFNGMTWYEKQFRARLRDPAKYKAYRERVDATLNTFLPLNISEIDFIPNSIMDELQPYFSPNKTFKQFFKSIPQKDRCRLMGPWLKEWMNDKLFGVFSNEDWVIPLDFPFAAQGGSRQTRKIKIKRNNSQQKKRHRAKRKTVKFDDYYCPLSILRLQPAPRTYLFLGCPDNLNI